MTNLKTGKVKTKTRKAEIIHPICLVLKTFFCASETINARRQLWNASLVQQKRTVVVLRRFVFIPIAWHLASACAVSGVDYFTFVVGFSVNVKHIRRVCMKSSPTKNLSSCFARIFSLRDSMTNVFVCMLWINPRGAGGGGKSYPRPPSVFSR